MASAPRWKDFPIPKLIPLDCVLVSREDLPVTLGSLSLHFGSSDFASRQTNDKFNFFVNHPAQDYLTPCPGLDSLKKLVMTYLIANGK
eukprot:1414615-Rhodomonas_salina.1